MREGHPVLWALDDRRDGLAIEYPYFETAEPLVWDEPGTYVETDVEFTQNVTHEWNHGLGEIVTALLDAGMAVTGLVEHDSVPWEALPGQMEDVGGGEWRLTDRPERLPHTYTLQADQARLIVRAASIDCADHRPWSKPHARAWARPQLRSRSRSIPRSASASRQRPTRAASPESPALRSGPTPSTSRSPTSGFGSITSHGSRSERRTFPAWRSWLTSRLAPRSTLRNTSTAASRSERSNGRPPRS